MTASSADGPFEWKGLDTDQSGETAEQLALKWQGAHGSRGEQREPTIVRTYNLGYHPGIRDHISGSQCGSLDIFKKGGLDAFIEARVPTIPE